jgi:hypothetical protein
LNKTEHFSKVSILIVLIPVILSENRKIVNHKFRVVHGILAAATGIHGTHRDKMNLT